MSKIIEILKRDLSHIIGEDSFSGDKISLLSPSGRETTAYGMINSCQVRRDAEGNDIIINNPSIMVQLSSLEEIPGPGEKWIIRIGDISYSIEDRPIKNETLDRITFNLRLLRQS